MRLREAISSTFHLLVVMLCLALAGLSWILPFRPDWCLEVIRCLADDHAVLFKVGLGWIFLSLVFALAFFAVGRGKFLNIVMGSHRASVERKVLQQVIEAFFREHFKGQVSDVDVAFGLKNSLEIAVDIPSLASLEKAPLLEKAEKGISTLLRERFGYEKPFTLSVRSKQ